MLDFLQDVIFESEWDEWDDCNLSREDMKHFTTPPTALPFQSCCI
jgi:hypothetical protein